MDTSKIEKKLVELDKELHSILKMMEEQKEEKSGIVESAHGAWGYDVESVDYVRELSKSDRAN